MKIAEEILEKIESLPMPKIIAVSGFGGSGKSSFAQELSSALNAPVVGVDSFQKNRTDNNYSLWSIMDFARLEQEVLVPFLKQEETIRFGHFDWSANGINKTDEIKNTGVLIIEGVGLFRPELEKYFSYKIWVDCPLEIAIARGKKRDREVHHNPQDESWDGVWKENDLEYYESFKPKEKADIVVDNS